MAKQLNVSMKFTADTTQAKNQMQELSNILKDLTSGTFTVKKNFVLTEDIKKATLAATDLRIALESAMDVNTGNLDLKQFNNSLKKSGTSLSDYAKHLSNLGPEGQKAFSLLSKSIVQAEVPLKRTSKILDEFKTSLANTARWQLSSSVLHAFMGALQTAYGYAQDLNSSLNDIRIVTGYSSDEMARFAVEANNAAKALSTTTTDYTKASLIYYQQGLSNSEVKERTDVTIKMANVARQSAEIVSDQMTAVWNNFDDGSKSLEYYADVMTALGAATASSTDEIAQGLEKFAAVSETVGLSYEYATAALATVTAETRQSADVVGTAFKTLFARIQGLELGETLEDGTTLNDYSEALAKVGVNIKQANGELKGMDQILTEMARVWDTLGKAEQVALAEKVAGVRQYNQLMSLMNDWDVMEENLDTARNAEGALNEQADIYAESWEAADKRVKASFEDIYDSILDDKFFIQLTDAFGGFLEIIGTAVDGLGGMKGVLLLVGSALMKAFGPEINNSLNNFIQKITHSADKLHEMKKASIEELTKGVNEMGTSEAGTYSTGNLSLNSGVIQKGILIDQMDLTDQLYTIEKERLKKGKELTEEEKKRAQLIIDQNTALGNQLVKQTQLTTKSKKDVSKSLKTTSRWMGENSYKDKQIAQRAFGTAVESTNETITDILEDKLEGLTGESLAKEAEKIIPAINKAKDELTKLANEWGINKKEVEEYLVYLDKVKKKLESINKEEKNPITFDDKINQKGEKEGTELDTFDDPGLYTDDTKEHIQKQFAEIEQGAKETGEVIAKTVVLQQDYVEGTKKAGEEMRRDLNPDSSRDIASGIVGIGQAFLSFGSVATSIKGVWEAWQGFTEGTLSSSDAMIQAIGGIGAAIPAIKNGIDGVKAAAVALKMTCKELVILILAITAVVGALSYAYKTLNSIYNADSINAERAAKAAKELADEAKAAREEADALANSIKEYEELEKTLKECSKGTEEWSENLKLVNENVNKLLQTYPELLKEKELFNNDGTLNTNILKSFQEEKENKANEKLRIANYALAQSQSARVTSDITDFARGQATLEKSISRYREDTGESFSIWKLSELDLFQPGSIEDDVRADVEAVLKQFKIVGEEALNFETVVETIGQDLDTANVDYINSLIDLTREHENAAQAMRNVGKSTVVQWSKSEEGKQFLGQQELSDAQISYMANAYNAKVKQITEDAIAKDKKENSSWSRDDQSGLFKRWNEANDTNYKLAKNGIRGDDNNREYYYLNDDGTEDSITRERMISEIAAIEALEDLGHAAEAAAKFLNGIDTGDSGVDEGLQNFIATNSFNSMSEEEFYKLFNGNIVRDESGNITNQNGQIEALIKSSFGENATEEEIVKAFGVETFQDVIDLFIKAGNDTAQALSTAGDHITDVSKGYYNQLSSEGILTKYNVEEQRAVGDLLDTALGATGTEGVKVVSETFRKLGEDGDEFAAAIQDVDWQITDLKALKGVLDEAGVSVKNVSDKDLQLLIDSLYNVSEVSQNIEQLEENFSSLNDVLKNIDGIGSIISQEDYEKLNPEIADVYFTKMLDGTYILTKSAEEFYKAVEEGKYDEFEKAIIETKNSAQRAAELGAMDYDSNFSGRATSKEVANNQIDYLEKLKLISAAEAENFRVLLETSKNLDVVYGELEAKIGNVSNQTGVLTEQAQEQMEQAEELFKSYQLQYFIDQLPDNMAQEDLEKAVIYFTENMRDTSGELNRLEEEGVLENIQQEIENMAEGFASAGAGLESATNLIDGISSGSITRDNIEDSEDYATLMDQLKVLKETYPEIIDEVAILNNKWMVGTDAYEDALSRIQDLMYSLQMNTLSSEFSTGVDEITQTSDKIKELVQEWKNAKDELTRDNLHIEIQAETKKFEEQMEKLLQQEYEINVAIHAEMEQEFDEIIDKSQKMEQYAAKIGEDYIVAAEDIRELNQVFPGIIDNMKILEDGSVQLNKVMVANAMNSAESEMHASTKSTVSQIDDTIALLESKKTIYKNIANACEILSHQEILSEQQAADTRGYISEQLGELEELNSKQAADSEMLNMKEVADNSNDNAKVMANNYASAAQSMANSFKAWGDYAVQVMNAVENKTAIPSPPRITPNYTGSGGVEATATQGQDLQSAIDSGTDNSNFYEEQQKYWKAQIEATDEQINDLEGIKGELLASDKALNLKLNNVEEGKGIDPKEEEEKERGDIHYKDLDDEIERYHEINEELEDINRNLNRISKEKDKAFGQAKLDMIDAEIAATEELIDAQERYIKEAERNYYSDQAILRGFGAQFDEAGRISNYDQLMASEVARYNSMAARYDGIEGWESAMESANKRYEDFQEAISNYEESLNTLEEKEDELKDYVDQVAELKLAKIEYEVEVKVLLNDTELDYLEYLLDNLENQAFDGAKNAIILEQQAQIVKNSLEANQEGIEDIFKSKGASQAEILAAQKGNPSALAKYDFTEDEVNSILGMMESMLDYNKELIKINEEMKELVSKTWEESNKKIDKYLDRYEYFGALTESYLDIIDIVGQKALDIPDVFVQGIQKVQTQIGKANIESYVDDLKRLKSDLAAIQKQIAEAEKAGNQEYLEMWSKQEEEILKRYTETQQNLLSTISDSLQTVMNTYTEKLQTIFEYFEKEMVIGHDSLEKFAERFDRNTILNDQYLPEYKKIYELSKLTRKINDSIDNTNSLKAKKELRSLQQQINALQKEGVEVSEYDLNFLQKKYDLELARLSLEESREAKSEVRLVRDAEGAYGYVYTANDDAISDAQQKYEDALYETQSLNEGYISDLQADYIATQQEMMQTLSGMKMSDYGSPEAYRAAFEETYSFYQKRLQYYSNELGKVLDNNSLLYTDDVLTYDAALKIKELRGESFTMHFKDTVLGNMLGNYNTLADYTENLVQIIGSWDDPSTLLGELNNNWQEWHSAVDEILQATGTSVEDFGETVLYTLMGNDNPENVVAIMFGATDQSKVALEGFIEFLDNDTSEGLTRLQQTFIETMIEPNGTSAAESMRLLTEAAGYPNTKSGYLNALCQVFGYTGDDAEKLKNRIRAAVGAGGSITSSDTILGALSDMEIKGSRNFSNLEKNVYGSIYEGTSGHGGIIKAVEDTEKSVDKLERESANDFKEMIKKVDAWENDWVKEFKNAREYTNKLYISYMKLVEAMNQARRYPDDIKRVVTTHVDEYEDQPYSYKNPDTTTTIHNNTEDDNWWDDGEETYGVFGTSGVADNYKNWFTSTTDDPWTLTGYDNVHKSGTKDKYTFEKNGVERSIYLDSDQYEKLLKQGYFIEPFDTGGYTGDWGTSNGRLALLHEKELILNKSDTKNMLSAISVLRDLVSKIELNSLMAMTTNIQSPFALASEKTSDTIQQNVTIQADFPNVQDHNEIEQALNSLTLKASQYVNRK